MKPIKKRALVPHSHHSPVAQIRYESLLIHMFSLQFYVESTNFSISSIIIQAQVPPFFALHRLPAGLIASILYSSFPQSIPSTEARVTILNGDHISVVSCYFENLNS